VPVSSAGIFQTFGMVLSWS